MMTSHERLIAAMRREDVDRIPLSPRMANAVSRHYKSGSLWAYKKFKKEVFDCDPTIQFSFPAPNPFLSPVEPLPYLADAEMELNYANKGDHFVVTRSFCTPAGPLTEKVVLPKPGVKAYGASPNPHRVEHLIKEPADLEKIPYLLPKLEGLNFAEYHHAVEEMGEDGLVQLNIPGPMDYWGGEAYPMEQMMVDYYERPEFFDALLDLFARNSIERVKVAVENGVKHFFLVYFYPSLSTGWSPKIIEEKFVPIIKKQAEIIHQAGGLVDYYDDGKLMESTGIFISAGIDVLETCSPPPVGDFNLAEARKRWDCRVTFKGLVDMINVIMRGTPAKIEAHVRDIIAQNGGKKALILGTMDNIRPETSDENIAAYFKAANKYR